MVPSTEWPALASLPLRPLADGLINDTWAVGEPPVAVIQRLHRIFAPEVNLDIDAVTAHLEAWGLTTPRPLRTAGGQLWHIDGDGACWRALSWVPGRTVHRVQDPSMAAEAGALVARWHRATDDLDHRFAFARPGAHDTDLHMERLRAALEAHPDHRLRDDVARLAEGVAEAWAAWPGALDLPTRIAHGDLKISNLRFDEAGRGLCLLDLDTMGRLPLAVELGDAWRSWCNPRGEDVADAALSTDLFEAAAGAYLATNPLPPEERAELVFGVERICLELAARFAADALAEAYFGWNPALAPARGEHNLLRARGQASLASSVARQRSALLAAMG
jgi:Ser/Thr protein kinase RdoA (MazF antagonist)